ncbi:hypothetical protein O181_083391 [Austropuccinia psidii MF-1]|uniref:Uncharacterized protein n=1 Tax=Austropuccinia psidii MF-1 TaxID=1389203 RepID=A0A9Q3FNY7_9BASI|nr:hypothetical protein [Austropuccinia psidii MF-1]
MHHHQSNPPTNTISPLLPPNYHCRLSSETSFTAPNILTKIPSTTSFAPILPLLPLINSPTNPMTPIVPILPQPPPPSIYLTFPLHHQSNQLTATTPTVLNPKDSCH